MVRAWPGWYITDFDYVVKKKHFSFEPIEKKSTGFERPCCLKSRITVERNSTASSLRVAYNEEFGKKLWFENMI